MSKHPAVIVPDHVWAELAEADLTPPLVLGDMNRWVSQYSFPYWMTKYEERCLTLERRGHVGEDRWVLLDRPHCYNKRTGRWTYEMFSSGRSDDFLRDCRMTLVEARPIIVREVTLRHRHCLRKVARIITLSEMREAATAAEKAQEGL